MPIKLKHQLLITSISLIITNSNAFHIPNHIIVHADDDDLFIYQPVVVDSG